MNTIQSTRCFTLKSLLALLTPIMLFTPHAYAETYVAGQMGVTLPSIGSGLSNTDLTGVFIQGSALSDQALTSSILYGAKVGHYFTAVPWVGLEAEVYNTTPHIKQQSLEFFCTVRGKRWLCKRHRCELSSTHARTTERDVSLPQNTTSTVHCHWTWDIPCSIERSLSNF